MPPVPPELLLLPPLAVAAGIDLYLTLLLLGASPTIGLWDRALPGALSDLDSPAVLLVVGAMYLLEFAAERYAATTLLWNAVHAIIRPLSAALLALLVLEGQPPAIVVSGATLSGLLASLSHAARSGGTVVRRLGPSTSPHPLLVSLLEDTIVLGLVALSLDSPWRALAAAGGLAVLAAARIPSDVRAFAFAMRLAMARVLGTFGRSRWLAAEELPRWVRAALTEDAALAAGGAVRGTPVGAHRLPGSPRFVTGWLLVLGRSPVLVFRTVGRTRTLAIGSYPADGVVERTFLRRLDLRKPEDGLASVFFGLDGPSVAALRAEFLSGPG